MINRILAWFGLRLVRDHADKEIARQAKVITDSPEATAMAKANAAAILAALAEGRSICAHCHNPFEYRKREWGENVRLRAILMIPDQTRDPMICDPCFTAAIGAFNGQATNVGTRNDGPANLCLQRFA